MSGMSDSAPKARPGGRTARTRRAVIDAAVALLFELSPGEVTVARVAARSGVHETTIFRKWGTKDALLTDVLLTLSAERLVTPDTGSLRGDLVETISAVAEFLRTPAGYALAYLGSTADDPTTATIRNAFWDDRFTRAQAIFDRAADRGEITDATVAPLAYEALIGTMHFRILARRKALDHDIAEHLVDLVLSGVHGYTPDAA